MAKKMRATFRAVLALVLFFACLGVSAQVDRGQIEPLYRDLQSSDWWTRQKAFEAIQQNAEYLKDPETADRFLVLLEQLAQEIRRRSAAGLDSEGLGEGVLGATWGLWKERLTPEVFRVFASASYSSRSWGAMELGAHAGRFVSTLLPLTNDADEFVRENATALAGYALASDYVGAQPLSPTDRAALRSVLSAASADRSVGVRYAAVYILRLQRDAWAIPVLERMYEREPSLHPTGEDQQSTQLFRAEMKKAIQEIRSRGQMPSPDFDALQANYRDLRSSDPAVRLEAINALVKRADFLNFVDTPDRLLRLLDLETRAIRSRSSLEKGSAAQGDTFYETLLATTWDRWKDKLTYLSFRVFAVSVYGASSAFAKELGAHSVAFAGVLSSPPSETIPPQVRDNVLTLMAYALAEDEKGAVRAPPNEKRWLTAATVRAAEDRDPAVRLAVVNALRQAGGAWALPVLEQMDEREPSFYPVGKGAEGARAIRATVKEAIQAIRSRAEQPQP